MTLAQAITRVLKRVGMSSSTSEFQDVARTYINLMMAETVSDIPWWWLDITTTFATVDGTRTYNPISGQVTAWWSFVDETNNYPLDIIDADSYDSFDPDRSESGDARDIYISGVDATTGYPAIDVFPLPDSADTIRVRYRKDVDEWTSSNDASDFLTLGIPRIIESVLVYGATSLYLEELGDDSGAGREAGNLDRVMRIARKQNIQMQGNKRFPPITQGGQVNALIRVDSSLAVP